MSIGPNPDRDSTDGLLRALKRHRARARAVLLFERAWPALWPAAGIAGLFFCLALLDVPLLLPAWLHVAALALFALAFAVLLYRGIRSIAAPRDEDADRRLESASGLRHRPLSVLSDKPALPGSETIWRAHVARAAAQMQRLRTGFPHPGLAARDRRALRSGLIVALVACFVIAGDEAPMRLLRAVSPSFIPPTPPPPSQLQAWITPPPYTGLAPVFLKYESRDVSVPAGSHLTVNITGGSGAPAMTVVGQPQTFQALDASSYQADVDLKTGGRLEVRRHGSVLGAWELTVVADTAPVVLFPEPPGRARNSGRVPQVRLPWQVSHQYGVASLGAEIRLAARPDAAPLVVAIPLPGGTPKTAKGVRVQDLTAHPWAGLPVVGRLVAKDAPGLTGVSEDARFTLPERHFDNPLAQALMQVRKDLSKDPDNRAAPIIQLSQLGQMEDAWNGDFGAYLNLRSIIAQLHFDRAPGAVDAVQQRMWLLALHLEEGAPERTARSLEQARQALRELLDAQKQGEKVDSAELDKRMRDVEEALQKHLQALAEQARRDPDSQTTDQETRELDARDMQKLAEDARKAAQEGRMDDAREKMAELDKMLDELQNARPEHGQMTERQRQRAEKRQKGQQQMNALQDIVRREGALLDTAQARDSKANDASQLAQDARRQNNLPQFPRPGQSLNQFLNQLRQQQQQQQQQGQNQDRQDQQAGQPPDASGQQADPQQQEATKDRQGEQRVQQALRRALGELMQQYGDLTGQVPQNLGDADTAMRDSGQALGQGKDGQAAASEQKAIEALQKGGRSMSMQMAQQFGRSGGQQEGDEGDDGDQDGSGDQAGGSQDGGQYGGQQYGRDDGRGTRPWDSHGRADRRADDRRDPLGRPLKEGSSGSDESGDVQVPEKMEEARTREIQEELRRRDGDRSRPQPELDYIERLLKQF